MAGERYVWGGGGGGGVCKCTRATPAELHPFHWPLGSLGQTK